jgi:alkylation response protein AidB-like acyl-CoA dehydrogenase
MSTAATKLSGESFDELRFAALKAEIAEWVADEGERWTTLIESEHRVPDALWDELRDRGYLRLAAPVELGGLGLPFARYLELLELLSTLHGSIRMIVHVSNGIWRSLLPYANAEQIERFVKPQVATEIKVAFTLTEPYVGTGADIRASVTREGDTYYLSGEKHLITFGTISDYLLLAARLEGTSRYDGTIALMVPAYGEGITNERMPEGMGLHGTDHSHLIFDRAPVPVANRLGEEGQGLEVAIGGFLVPSRISLAMSCVGLAQRALEEAIKFSHERVTFGKPIAKRQAVAFRIAQMATDVEAGRRLVLHAADEWERDPAASVGVSAMAKLFASQMVQRVTDEAITVHGGTGYLRSPIERIYRDARAQRFEEGTYDIQMMTIAKEILG